MEKQKFIDKFTMFAAKLGSEIHLRSLRDAFATMMPLYILAGLAVLLNNTVFTWVFSGDVLTTVQYWGNILINGTLNVSGLIIAALVAYHMASNREFKNPLAAMMLSVATLVIMMPTSVVVSDVTGASVEVSSILTYSNLGTGSMFAGIIIGLIATELFVKISSIKKLQVNLGDNIPTAVGNSFNLLIPVMLVMSIFAVIATVLFTITGLNLINIITMFIQEPLRHVSTGLWGCVILYSLGNALWFFGIHQSVIYSSLLEPLLIINITENIAAYNAGETIPNIINVSQVTSFGMIGGSGSTICLLIATFLISKNAYSRNVAKLSTAPGLFNINEPIIFGYPIVYNLTMIIPFVLVPAMGIIVSYFATVAGIMDPCVVQVPWTTPPLLSGFLATAGDYRAIFVQAGIIVAGVLMYLPFIKMNDVVLAKQAELENKETED